MLLPKRVKYRRVHRGRMKGVATRGNKVSNGEYGLQTLEPAWITSNQIEAARVAMTRYIKRGGQVWIKIFPDKPITKKPAGTRMGSGKGAPEQWVAVVKPGRVMFEIGGVSEDLAREAMRLAAYKLPVKASEIRNLSVQELNEKLSDLKSELFNLRFQHAINQLENPMRLGAVKKDIARVKTIIREKELAERK